ncbi:MAG: FAD:protein FMN transferase, partial [Patescibacteria group bacterium]
GKKNPEVSAPDEPYDIDFSTVVIDRENSWIQLNVGQKLDFGGFLKGYLAEKIAKKIKAYSPEIAGVIVNLGGDIHTRGIDENGNEFMFDIHNPIDGNKNVLIPLRDESLATSGTYKRAWLNSGKKIHHILDASGERNPTSDIVSASVIYKDGARAEAYTKVFLSMGPESSMNLLGNNHIFFVTTDVNGQVLKNTP